ncbi:hypothetical protein GGTG_13357 [Gaeumannomyces tritici R3-111a-1]|uniref:Cytochrome P450 n=1 Tax=Gaeumannomyces tritici (strain R3-111a-1) TaxID=644352 RepID=J3PIM8_GAET3|nr:hypothetical protein GGTG_13357 [Gaeumannomyces tritici R3-111a-1]EJT69089.1 hypothetical protein GGTG_13357 [Gaeumannomyces tritici R3-111a-1]
MRACAISERWIQADSRHQLLQVILFHMRQSEWTIQQRFLNKTIFITVDPANLEAMLNSKARDYSISPRHQVAAPLSGDGVFTLDGEAWRRSRARIRPHLAHGHYEDLSPMQQPVDDLLAAMSRSADAGDVKTVDLQPLFFGLTLDVTTSLLLGESIRSLASGVDSPERAFADALDRGLGFLARRFRLPGLHWLVGGRAWRRACADVHAFIDGVVDRNLAKAAAAGGEKKPSFPSRVAEACPDREALRGQIVNVLGAGRDTTACFLSRTFFVLVRHPDALSKLRTEIANTPI